MIGASVSRRRRRLGERQEAHGERTPYVVFGIAGDEYALPIGSVSEILRLGDVRTVPGARGALHGLMNHRDRDLAVLDVAVAFGWPAIVPTAHSCVLVTGEQNDAISTGLAVDTVRTVLELDAAHVVGMETLAPVIDPEFIRGVARLEEALIPILNVERVLDLSELREACAAAEGNAR